MRERHSWVLVVFIVSSLGSFLRSGISVLDSSIYGGCGVLVARRTVDPEDRVRFSAVTLLPQRLKRLVQGEEI